MKTKQQIFKHIALENGYCTDKSVVNVENDLELIYKAMDEYAEQSVISNSKAIINHIFDHLGISSADIVTMGDISQALNQWKENNSTPSTN